MLFQIGGVHAKNKLPKIRAYFFRGVTLMRLGKNRDALANCEQVSDDFFIFPQVSLAWSVHYLE